MEAKNQQGPAPSRFAVAAADGYMLQGSMWTHPDGAARCRPVVIVNPATSVRCRYYAPFAAYLHARGFTVILYDYRGIGESRPPELRRLNAGWLEWGRLDFEAILQYAVRNFAGCPIHVVAHSVGGFLIGLAPSNHLISRVFTMGAQFAYWRDYARSKRLLMLLKWHGVMPLLSALCGYFPGRRLGWLEDTPRGVVREWTARHARFEDAYCDLSAAQRQALVEGFAALRGATLALSVSDDEFGTVAAIRRLLGYFRHSPQVHLHLTPAMLGCAEIGHFGFFQRRFASTLWPIALSWLEDGRLPAELQAKA